MTRRALVAGATGLIGRHLLQELSARDEYSEVVALTRRPGADRANKLRWLTVDFDALPPLPRADVFCALGTTLKRAGSREAFQHVDHDLVVELAQRSLEAGAPHFLMVSALGADERSRIFYNRVKGAAESSVLRIGLPTVCVFRPSLLLGDRTEKRTGERLGAAVLSPLAPWFVGRFEKYRPIGADVVARAMVRAALDAERGPGVHIFESDQIAALGV